MQNRHVFRGTQFVRHTLAMENSQDVGNPPGNWRPEIQALLILMIFGTPGVGENSGQVRIHLSPGNGDKRFSLPLLSYHG